MRPQVIAGGAIVVISVVSATAFGIMQGNKWFRPALQNAAQVQAVNAAPAAKTDGAETATAWLAQGGKTENDAAAAPAAQPSATVTPAAPSPEQAPHQVSNQAQNPEQTHAANPPAAAKPAFPCANPNAMGVSRVVQIDTTGGPGFGSQHFKTFDFLRDHEVVLTFDDGPWPTTPLVLKALADQCLRATFFSIGKHATWHPEILKQVIAAGHTVGSHTWSHADLQALIKKSGQDAAIEEIEKGASAVHLMAGAPIAPFFRFPDLRHPPEMLTYLGHRNIASFSTDIDSWDYKIRKPEELVRSLMARLNKRGKGIILMHDFQRVTSIALPQILAELQKNGYKVVHMVPKTMLATLPKYDEEVLKENKLPTLSDNRPMDSVVHTISGE